MDERQVVIPADDGTSIPAVLTAPSEDYSAVKRWIIMLHGITVSKDEHQGFYRRLARLLARNGVGSVRFDFRGHGDSAVPASGFTVSSQIMDALTVVNWTCSTVGSSRVTFLGTSFGSPPAIVVSEILADRVESLVLLAPVIDYERTFVEPETPWGLENFGSRRLREGLLGRPLKIEQDFELSPALIFEMLTLDPQRPLTRISSRIFLLHGDKDEMVPFAASQACANRHQGISFKPLPNTGHGFAEINDDAGTSAQTKANLDLIASLLSEG
jgi:pimeloyl-ACP methyl ester carboxylesterase